MDQVCLAKICGRGSTGSARGRRSFRCPSHCGKLLAATSNVILTLEVTGPQAARMGGAGRQEFGPDGGSIGRENGNTWVLPHTKVSGIHALITHRSSVFYIEDRSRNGVCLNSVTNRLVRGQPYPLKSGDSVFIDPYEIRVSVKTQSPGAERRSAAGDPGRYSPDVSDPFDADPFGQRGSPLHSSSEPENPFESRRGAGPAQAAGSDTEAGVRA